MGSATIKQKDREPVFEFPILSSQIVKLKKTPNQNTKVRY